MTDIVGTEGVDTLTGTNGDDTITGLGGNDTINARGGNDVIEAGAGADTVIGGTGNDIYVIDTLNDFAVGDSFDGGADYDTIQISVTNPGFLLSSLSYIRVEALISTGDRLGVTLAQLNGFIHIDGYFNLLGSGSLALGAVTLAHNTTFDLAPAITTFTYTATTGDTIWVSGGDGGVTLTGSASNDNLWSGAGNDALSGGAGGDMLTGNGGADVLNGGDGDDTLLGCDDGDTLIGGGGTDNLYGDGGSDSLFGGLGDDTIEGGDGVDIIYGEDGRDIIFGGGGDDQIDGGTEDDYIFGDDENDAINGGLGDDYINGGTGNDTLIGGGGIDSIYGGEGDDVITYTALSTAYGGAGYDELRVNLSGATGPTDLDLTFAFNTQSPPYFQPIGEFEELGSYLGSAFEDSLTVGIYHTAATQIDTGAGNDAVVGGAGADTILLGTGNDDASGGDGDDIIHGGDGNDGISGEGGADHLFGDDGNDTFYVTESQIGAGESIDGGAGDDTLWLTLEGLSLGLAALAVTGVEHLILGDQSYPGTVTVAQLNQFSSVQGYFHLTGSGAVALGGTIVGGTATQDHYIFLDVAITSFTYSGVSGPAIYIYAGNSGVTITGSASVDGLIGGLGSDVLSGGLGNDYLTDGDYDSEFAFNGNDQLDGGGGNDLLQGGAGLDTLDGGDGDDAFQYVFAADSSAGSRDTIIGGAGFDTLNMQVATGADGSVGLLNISGIERAYGGPGVRATVAELAQFSQIGGEFTVIGTGQVTTGGLGVLTGTTFTLDASVTGFDFSAANYILLPNASYPSGYVIVNGNANGETIIAGNGYNEIFGNGGNDTIYGGAVTDSLNGGAGDDRLYGGDGSDGLIGGTGRDELYGGDGNDALNPGSGAAVVAGEIYDGGAGFDTLSLTDPDYAANLTGVTLQSIEAISSDPLFSFLGTGQMLSVQQLSGKFALTDNAPVSLTGITHFGLRVALANGGQAFSLAGSIGNYGNPGVTVYGGTGNDTITGGNFMGEFFGGDGDDTLIEGTTYLHTMDGGAGNDRLVFSGGGIGYGGTGFDTLVVNGNFGMFGVSGLEAIELSTGSSLILSGSQIAQGFASNTVLSGSGSITVNLDLIVVGGFLQSSNFAAAQMTVQPGSNVTFTVNGSGLSDLVKANLNVRNTINGGDGGDQLRGGNLIDVIIGGNDTDKIMGLGGADILTGGAGNDQFRYMLAGDSGLGAAADHITDFAPGSDKLDFRLLDADPVAPGRQVLVYIDTQAFHATGAAEVRYGVSGANLLVEVDLNGDGVADMQIVLDNDSALTLSSGDFLL